MNAGETFFPGRANGEKLTKESINSLPLYHYSGKIVVVQTEQAVLSAVEAIAAQPVVGFDTETRPSFRKGKTYDPSLIQIATPKTVFLFPLKKVAFSDPLCSLMENSHIVKTGVAIHDDLKGLCRLKRFTPASILDLSHVAKANGIAYLGLRWLAAHFLGVRISKGEQCSNWGKTDLTEKQVLYAATDAWASLAIYLRMREEGMLPTNGAAKKSRNARHPF